MLALVSRSLRLAAPAAAPARAFSAAAVARKDFVQEAYLRELKAYKPAPKAADAHVGQVRDFSAPSAPQAPAVPSSSDLSSELDAYAKSEPDTAEKAASSSSAAPDASNRQTAEQFLEEAARDVEKEAHH